MAAWTEPSHWRTRPAHDEWGISDEADGSLAGALVLKLVMAAPAAANEKVYIPEHSDAWTFEVQVSIAEGWDF